MDLKKRLVTVSIRTQPKTIIDRLLKNYEFLAAVGLTSGQYPGIGSFQLEQVVHALQLAATQNAPVVVRNNEGAECQIERTPDGIKVTNISKADGHSTSALLADFELLDPDPSVRLAALATLEEENPPWLPVADKLRAAVFERTLNEVELAELTRQLDFSPIHFFRGMEAKRRDGTLSLLDVFPTSIEYYEMLVGPRPTSDDVDHYVIDILPSHQKRALERNLPFSIEFFLPASLRHDISLVGLLSDFPDDTVWQALGELDRWATPFPLIGALELALARAKHDARFRDYAASAIERLTSRTFTTADGQDAYVFLPPLVRLCLGVIGEAGEISSTPPFWRRLAAFVHCHLLLEILPLGSADPQEFTDLCDSLITQQALTAELIDLRAEPLWRPSEFDSYSMRAEVLKRLQILAEQANDQEFPFPERDVLDRALSELPAPDLTFCGPLEGHLRMRSALNALRPMAESTREEFGKKISSPLSDPADDVWNQLCIRFRKFSHSVAFDDSLLEQMIQAIDRFTFSQDSDAAKAFFGRVSTAAYVAASQPDENLSDAVARVVNREAGKFTMTADADAGFQILLTAAAAFPDRGRWLDWLTVKLKEYAFSLPRGEASACLSRNLESLSQLMPVHEWRFGQARKAASSAMR